MTKNCSIGLQTFLGFEMAFEELVNGIATVFMPPSTRKRRSKALESLTGGFQEIGAMVS
ncbi:hypothetical protein [Mesorhizobium shangrilense]|uniref:Uncharacterized protein n=1 Tax=Mesorhizobium shangrilense TaxID=460060 RepID=A0ABV2DSQ0_9HYPH